MSLFSRVLLITYIIDIWIITHQEPIEGIKVRLLLWYPSNIFEYPSKYRNYASKKKFGRFPQSPRPPLQCITFLLLMSQKILLNIKDVEFDFRMGCILVFFLFLSIINVQFTNFGFWIFLFSNIAVYLSSYSKTTFTYKIWLK